MQRYLQLLLSKLMEYYDQKIDTIEIIFEWNDKNI